jgi:diacylglycerol kinase (ATP)
LDERVFVVFNPCSGKGRGARLVQPVLEALRASGPVEHALTTVPGEEEAIAESALRRGFRRVVAVGGDGTWCNVGNALVRAGGEAALGLIAGGTGCDLAKSIGVPGRDLAACVRIVRQGAVRSIDVGRIEDRYFLNVAGFGFDIAVIEDSLRVRHLRGDLLYVYCALRQLWRYAGFPVQVGVDGAPAVRRELMMLIVANARVFGGAFPIAPRADLSDGRLDYRGFRNMGVGRRLAVMARLLRGTHEAAPEVECLSAARLDLRFAEPPAYETDGEWRKARSAEITIEAAPRALRVLVPPA